MKSLTNSKKCLISDDAVRKTSPANDINEMSRGEESGFTLIEVIIALVMLLIVLLGVFASFTYAINYNAGNNARSQALVVLQQEVERLRSAKFTPDPTVTDPSLTGGVKTPRPIQSADGNRFLIQISVDNDPDVAGIQDDSVATTLKEITVSVTLDRPTPGWQSAIPATVILRRVRAN